MSIIALALAPALAHTPPPQPVQPTRIQAQAPRLEAGSRCRAAQTWSTVGLVGTGVMATGIVAPLLIAPNSEAGALVPLGSIAVGAPMIVAGGIGTLASAGRCTSHRGRAYSAGIGYLAAGVAAPLTAAGLIGGVALAFGDQPVLGLGAAVGGVAIGAAGLAGLGLGVVQTTRLWVVPSSGNRPGLTVAGRF